VPKLVIHAGQRERKCYKHYPQNIQRLLTRKLCVWRYHKQQPTRGAAQVFQSRLHASSTLLFFVEMEAVFGCSERGKQTLIYRNFEYWKERENVCGTTSWRCRQFQRLQCKARVVTSGTRVVEEKQPDHTHAGNVAYCIL
jgi:hypothetical protein